MLALYIANLLRLNNPYWACISAFVVVQSDTGSTIKRCIERIIATLTGIIFALIFAKILVNYPLIALINTFVIISIGMSLSYRYDSYLITIAVVTFIMVAFNIYINPDQIIHTAFYRFTEVSLGIVCETIVSLLVFPNHALCKISVFEKNLVAQYRDFLSFVMECHSKKQDQRELFEKKSLTISDSIEKLAALRIGAKIESKLPWKSEIHTYEFEKYISNSKQVILRYYLDFFESQTQQTSNLEEVLTIMSSLGEFVERFQLKTIKYQEFKNSLKNLLEQAEKLDEKLFIKTYLIASIQLLVPEDQGETERDAMPSRLKISQYIELVNLKQGIKAAIATLIMPVVWIAFNLPGLDQIAVSAVILIRISQVDATRASILRLLGCMLGYLMGLIVLGLDITSFTAYLLILFLFIYAISVMFYSNTKFNYLPLQALIAFSLTELNSFGYTTDILPAFDRMVGIFFGIISSGIINNYIWPVNKKDLLKFRAALTLEAFAKVTTCANQNILSISSADLFRLYLEILKIKKLTFTDGFENRLFVPLRDLCYSLSIIRAINGIKGYKINEADKNYLSKLLAHLNKICSGEKVTLNIKPFITQQTKLPNSSERLLYYYLEECRTAMFKLQANLKEFDRSVQNNEAEENEIYKPLSF